MAEENKKGAKKRDPRLLRDLFWLSTLGINLVLSGAIGILIGHYLDKWLTTQPIFTIIFFLIGTFAGFRQIYKEIMKMAKEEEKQEGHRERKG